MVWKWIPASLALAICTLSACLSPPPVIEDRSYAPAKPSLDRVAVAPFHVGRPGGRTPSVGALSSEDAGPLVERIIAEEIAARGIDVVPARDVNIVFAREGRTGGKTDPVSGAAMVYENFGATALLLGEVSRFRDRVGTARGTTEPASVTFVLTLHAAPSGKKLWSAHFNETQVSFSAAPGRARRYPGGGRRWLTASELARFGARAAAEALVTSP